MWMRFYACGDSQIAASKEIFEVAKTAIPPMVTLVLGYYFGKSDATHTRPSEPSGPGQGSQKNAVAREPLPD